MFEWLSTQYVHLLNLYNRVLINPDHCSVYDVLRLFTFSLFFIFLLKTIFHTIVSRKLRQKYLQYSDDSHPSLICLYHKVIKKVGLRRIPPLHYFDNLKPLAFTIGFLKPRIFLTPEVINRLEKLEIESLLVHELIHIKRRDNLLFWGTEILFLAITLSLMQILSIDFFQILQERYLGLPISVMAILFTVGMIALFKLIFWKRFKFFRELSCDDVCVEITNAPLSLASALLHIWQFGNNLPSYRWNPALAFTQSFFPFQPGLEVRVRRLLNYRRPWFKFLIGKALHMVTFLMVFSLLFFLWKFYMTYCSLTTMN